MNSMGGCGASSSIAVAAMQRRVRVHQMRQPLAEGAIADLIVILQKRHQRRGWQVTARFAARFAAGVTGRLALERESFRQRAGEQRARLDGVILVVAVGLAGQQHVHALVEVVAPLRIEMRLLADVAPGSALRSRDSRAPGR